MIKIYLASRYSRRSEMEEYARSLQDLGLEVTSQWVFGERSILDNPADAKQFATMDRTDILRSDLIINFAEAKEVDYPRGSRHTEFGMAYQAGKVCYVVGRWGMELENIFHNLEGVVIFENWGTLYAHLEQLLIFERARRIMLKVSGLLGVAGAIGSSGVNGYDPSDHAPSAFTPRGIRDPGHYIGSL
jgi:hypothetical protein